MRGGDPLPRRRGRPDDALLTQQATDDRPQRAGAGRHPPRPPAAGTGYFFWSYSPSRWDFNCSTFSHFRSSSLAVSSLTFHLKLNSVPTGTFSATCFFASSFPSNSVTLALTSPPFSTAYS